MLLLAIFNSKYGKICLAYKNFIFPTSAAAAVRAGPNQNFGAHLRPFCPGENDYRKSRAAKRRASRLLSEELSAPLARHHRAAQLSPARLGMRPDHEIKQYLFNRKLKTEN